MKRALLLALLIGLLLIGCQGTPPQETPEPAPTAAEKTVNAATTTPTAIPTATPIPLPLEDIAIETAPATPSPTALFSPEPTPTPVPTPTPIPKPTATPNPTPFTLVWISDTQNYSRNNPEVFNAMRDWILEHREQENIQFVAHTGDVVDGMAPYMFENAANALVPIFEALPGMVVSGNHDLSKNDSQYYFLQRPYTQLVQKEGQTYNGGEAAYVTFSAAGKDFLVFGIGYNVICTAWMNEVIARFPDHIVITIVHRGLQETGELSKETRAIYLNVMPRWPNFRLILCGHERGTLLRTEWFDDDGDGQAERSVNIMMYNYQEDRVKGLGYMRLLRFNPMEHSIEVITYSPWFDQWGYPKAKADENHFYLINAW